MINDLKFVQGAVARKDYVPSLVHFRIQDRKVIGFNGAIALCAPIDINLACSPKAVPFVKAIQTCQDTIQLYLTETGRLAIRSGKFGAFVDCLEEGGYPDIQPSGRTLGTSGGIYDALKTLSPFIAEDASRPWARGVLFRGCSAFATNNIVAAQYWLGYEFPCEVNIPEEAVRELLRIGEEPSSLQVDEGSVTFHFGQDRWLRTQTLTTQWPDVERIFGTEGSPSPLPEGFFQALTDLAPFTDDLERVFLMEGKISTTQLDGTGASVHLEGIGPWGCFNLKQLQTLEGIVERIDLALYPAPCIFYGHKLRGAIMGMRP
jgi:DNA polymerase III sliding clamp (beta) subunit (PCNA family)